MVGRTLARFLVALGVIALASGLVFAQGISGSISGVVRDSTGGAVAGATVTARHIESGLTRTAITNVAGSYQIPELPIGEYEVSAEVSGFKKESQRGITLAVAQEAVVNLTLQVGDVTQEVTVEAVVQLVNTTVTSTSGLIRNEQINDLPLNGRSYLDLMMLNSGSNNNRSNTTNGDSPSFSIGGSRPDENRFTINGAEYVGNNTQRLYTSPQGMSGYLLGVDAVEEFTVQSGTYGAEYGKRGGAQVTIVSKSGTNQLHGSLFEYLRNAAVDSRNFFDGANVTNPTGAVPPFKRNQFGGSFGAPIKKDKLFVFGNFEGFVENLGVSEFGFVPDLQYRQGLLPNASGQYVTPPNLKPGILPFFNYWPLPTGPEVLQKGLPTGIATFSADPNQTKREYYGQIRSDYNISAKDRLSGNVIVDRGSRSVPNGNFLSNQTTDLYNFSAQETHIFSPSLVNVLSLGYSRAFATIIGPAVTPGIPVFEVGSEPGTINITGGGFLTNASAGVNPTRVDRRIDGISDDVKLSKGIHFLTMGFWFQRNPVMQSQITSSNTGGVVYPSLLSFLQDQPTSFNAYASSTELITMYNQVAWYLQDEIKLRKNLTVRLGLRDEMSLLPHDKRGFNSNYWGSNGNLNTQPTTSALFQTNNSLALWEPRVGLAWDPTGKGKWAVRAGYGMHNDLQDNFTQHLIRNPPYNAFETFTGVPMLPLIPLAPSAAPPNCTVVGQKNPPCVIYQASGVDPNWRTPTVQQWSLTLEHQLGQDFMVQAGYQGSHGYLLPATVDWNTIRPAVCTNSAGCLAGGVIAVNKQAIVPQGTTYVPVGLRPNPLLTSSPIYDFSGVSSYNALNLSLTKRMSHGLVFKASYTWSKALDENSAVTGGGNTNSTSGIDNPYDWKLDKGPASFNLKHQFSANASYQLPFGNGKKFGSGASGWEQKLIGAWQWNGILTASSGFPFTPLVGSNQSGNGDTSNSDVPNVISGCNAVLGVQSFKTTGQYFNPNCFTLPLAGTWGNAGRDQFVGPGQWNLDTSLFKRIPLKERLNMQFRVEFFNVLNHANFATPNLTVFNGTAISPTAGTIISTNNTGNGRQIQFALRLDF
jgi:hypothetical protein